MALANTSMGTEGLKLNITQNTSLNWIEEASKKCNLKEFINYMKDFV